MNRRKFKNKLIRILNVPLRQKNVIRHKCQKRLDVLIVMREIQEFGLHFLIAGITATISKTICAPIERVKLTLQNQDSAIQIINGELKRYNGILDCFIRIPKEQGFLSFWRGNGISIIRYFPTQSLNFSFNHLFKERLQKYDQSNVSYAIVLKFLAGGMAGAASTTLVYPLESCQTKISVDVGSDKSSYNKKVHREFNGLTDCVLKVRSIDGIKGLYSGYGVSVTGVAVYRALYFGLFDIVKKMWASQPLPGSHDTPKPPFLVALFFAQVITCFSGSFTYPLDTVGRRLMMESGRPKEQRLFGNTLNAFKVIYMTEGFSSFYKGLGVNCLRALSGALVLVAYDEILHYGDWKKVIAK